MKLIHIWRVIVMTFYELGGNLIGWRGRCKSNRRLDGKVAIVTGANAGIGKETAYQLTLRGAKVYIGCRDLKKGESAISEIKLKNPKANISVVKLDLSALASVREFAKQISAKESKLDLLINNAGIMSCPEWQTEDGFEMQFGTNHLGHFLLTLQLLPLMRKTSNARILNVSSRIHEIGEINFDNINLRNGAYNKHLAYANSKLANLLFSRQLAKRLNNTNINAYSLHPGAISTDLQRHVGMSKPERGLFERLFFLTPEMGAQTTLYCALEVELDNESGFYYSNCARVKNMVPEATDDVTAEKLWELSADLVKLEDHLKI